MIETNDVEDQIEDATKKVVPYTEFNETNDRVYFLCNGNLFSLIFTFAVSVGGNLSMN
jgi:hypothetical protein